MTYIVVMYNIRCFIHEKQLDTIHTHMVAAQSNTASLSTAISGSIVLYNSCGMCTVSDPCMQGNNFYYSKIDRHGHAVNAHHL